MKFLKAIFRKKKNKKQAKQNESWYNNSQDALEKGVGEIPMDPGSLAGESSIYIPASKQLNH
jgi:hypothetical protein